MSHKQELKIPDHTNCLPSRLAIHFAVLGRYVKRIRKYKCCGLKTDAMLPLVLFVLLVIPTELQF